MIPIEKIDDVLLNNSKYMLLIEDKEYFSTFIEIVNYIAGKKKNVIIINFDKDLRKMVEKVVYDLNVDPRRIRVVDTISIFIGKGTIPLPKSIPVHRPNSFTEIEIYTNMFINELGANNTCIMFYHLNQISEYETENPIALFLIIIGNMLTRLKVAEILVNSKSKNWVIDNIIRRHVDFIDDFTKEK